MTEELLTPTTVSPSALLSQRMQNWLSTVDMLIGYVEGHTSMYEKVQDSAAQVRKSINDAPKFGTTTSVFEDEQKTADSLSLDPSTAATPSNGPIGLDEVFRVMRVNTDKIQHDAEQGGNTLRSAVLPDLKSLRKEVERFAQNYNETGGKVAKEVDSARGVSQKILSRLKTASDRFAEVNKMDPKEDPYVIARELHSAIVDQVDKENTELDAIDLALEKFFTMEQHILSTIREAMKKTSATSSEIWTNRVVAETAISTAFVNVPDDYEWGRFLNENKAYFGAGNGKRDLANLTYPGMDDSAAQPVMEGMLQRKEGTIKKNYVTRFYVITKARYLHEFESENYKTATEPVLSLYLPECELGPADLEKQKFQLKGKVPGKTFGGTKTCKFRASTPADLTKWHTAILQTSGKSATTVLLHDQEEEKVAVPAPAAAAI